MALFLGVVALAVLWPASFRGEPASPWFRPAQAAPVPGGAGMDIYVEPRGGCGGLAPCYAFVQDGVDALTDSGALWISVHRYDEDVWIDLDPAHPVVLLPGWDVSFGSQQSATLTISSQPVTGTNLRSMTIVQGRIILEGQADVLDSDGDGLPDSSETNTGLFVSATDTGTDPLNPDTDGDELSDGDEVLGTVDGLDLPAMGVSPLRKNILLEYDWFDDALDCSAHSHRPTVAMVDRVSAAFEGSPVANPDGSAGITVIQDYGQGGVFDGGNFVADTDGVLVGGVNSTEFKNHKVANFADNRHDYFHYVLLPHRYNTNSSSSGQAELPGDDMIVSLYCAGSTRNVANTIMHELGHNLNLRHGGSNNCNWKPNYNSVMNYRYQFAGVDDDCTPQGNGVLDYSIGDRIALDESSLLEEEGICGGSNPWDWDGNGTIQPFAIAVDLNGGDAGQISNCGGSLSVLRDSDDWASIVFTGLNSSDGAPLYRTPEVIDCNNAPPSEAFD